jgi:hypothetical protein
MRRFGLSLSVYGRRLKGAYDAQRAACADISTLGLSGLQVDRLWSAREVVEDILTPDYVARRERELLLPG